MSPRLVILTDLERYPEPVPTLARLCQLAAPRALAIVLRDREASYRRRQSLGLELREVTARTDQFLLVSDRVDLALELGADGVHLPAAGLLPSHVERLLPGAAVSRAHHDAEAIPKAELARCAFLLISPAFAVRKGRPALLADGLRARCAVLRALAPRARLLALGGIDADTVGEALAAGADGVAAIAGGHDAHEQVALVRLLQIERTQA